jgi:hypothetical protein
MGELVVSGLVLARTANAAITLPTIQVFSTGCLMNVNIALRGHALSSEDYNALQMAIFPHLSTGTRAGRLPDSLLRFGVRFTGGAKATTVGQRFEGPPPSQDPPPGPRLSWLLGGLSQRSGDEDAAVVIVGLWLWPLPPLEVFELGVEWPIGGIELSIVELDGSALVAAARHSPVLYWPE